MPRWSHHSVLLVTVLASALPVSTPPLSAQVRRQFGIATPMRDGVRLVADAWLPGPAGKYPVLLMRTPYQKASGGLKIAEYGNFFAGHGYVFVVQDVRGRGDSEGEFQFFHPEGKDGFDTIEWLAAQPWSNGRVCTMGVSYLGTVQWLAARERPPHLVCMASTAAAGRWEDELPWHGGAFLASWALSWLNGTSGKATQGPNAEGIDLMGLWRQRPLLTLDSAMGRVMPMYRKWLTTPPGRGYWEQIMYSESDFARIDLPVLHVTGWFDGDQPGAMNYWRGMQARSPAKDRQYLISGPWTHEETFLGGSRRVGQMDLPALAILDMRAIHLAFFDRYLKGTAPAFDRPRARIFFTGSDVWRSFDDYPPKGMERRRLYLGSGGHANSMAGDGGLQWEPPNDKGVDQFTYDPQHPVPSFVQGGEDGSDRASVEGRDDILVYSSEVLTGSVDIAGDVAVELYAASDGMDTDFTAMLLDVYPDGRVLKLGMDFGIRRARYRNGYSKEEWLTPGEPALFRIELMDIAHRFQPGHRIRVEISSSAYPRYHPNQNTGNPIATDTEWRIARQQVYHDRAHQSAVILPVLPPR